MSGTETPAPKKRPWFQLHLSSAIVLMVVTGVFVGQNSRHRITMEKFGESSLPTTVAHYGWPFETYSVQPSPPVFEYWELIPNSNKGWLCLILNLAVFGLTLAASAVIVEQYIRRRERRHE
jgi:hypothetical protein